MLFRTIKLSKTLLLHLEFRTSCTVHIFHLVIAKYSQTIYFTGKLFIKNLNYFFSNLLTLIMDPIQIVS